MLMRALILVALLPAWACAQQATPLGSVATQDADVANGVGGTVGVSAGRATLSGNSTVTARAHAAEVELVRSGKIRVCQTSALHLTQATGDALLLGLDRGGLEIRLKATSPADALLTPDLRFTPQSIGPLDLQIRVSRNGDTCVDNRGKNAPVLGVSDAYGQATYLLKPGQHVLFEHGSVREVVDRESLPCGCPQEEKAVPLADALLRGGPGTVSPQQAAAANPFPDAQSEGLAPAPPRKPDTPGETNIQVSTTLRYDPSAKRSPAEAAETPASSQPPAPSSPPAGAKGNAFQSIGHFFKRLFVR